MGNIQSLDIGAISPTVHIGVIKGSEEAVRSGERYLSRSAYEQLSTRMYPTFGTQRSRVYDFFEQYLRKKRLTGDFDAADRFVRSPVRYIRGRADHYSIRTHKLLSAFKYGVPLGLGKRFDYL